MGRLLHLVGCITNCTGARGLQRLRSLLLYKGACDANRKLLLLQILLLLQTPRPRCQSSRYTAGLTQGSAAAAAADELCCCSLKQNTCVELEAWIFPQDAHKKCCSRGEHAAAAGVYRQLPLERHRERRAAAWGVCAAAAVAEWQYLECLYRIIRFEELEALERFFFKKKGKDNPRQRRSRERPLTDERATAVGCISSCCSRQQQQLRFAAAPRAHSTAAAAALLLHREQKGGLHLGRVLLQ